MAQRHLHGVKRGDRVFYYHTGKEKAIVGIAKAVTDAYPDPQDKSGKWAVVDIAPVERLSRPVTLAEIKADSAFKTFPLVRISRLSVMPVSDGEWDRIVAKAGGAATQFSLNPAGRATSAAGTSVETFITSLVMVMKVARDFGSSFFAVMRRPRPPSSPPTPLPLELDVLCSLCFCSAASCSADFTASIVTAVRIGVPSRFTFSARMRANASFMPGYMAIAAAISSGEAPVTIGPASCLA